MRVFKIAFEVELSFKLTPIPLTKAQRYEAEGKTYAERLNYTWQIQSGPEFTIAIQRELETKKQNVLFFVKKDDE